MNYNNNDNYYHDNKYADDNYYDSIFILILFSERQGKIIYFLLTFMQTAIFVVFLI